MAQTRPTVQDTQTRPTLQDTWTEREIDSGILTDGPVS